MYKEIQPNSIYSGDKVLVSTTEERHDKFHGIGLSAVGRGGAGLLSQRAIPWDEYVKLSPRLREIVHANTNVIIKPPIEWQQYVIRHITAFLEHDWFLARKLISISNLNWEISPYWEGYKNARKAGEIENIYEKYSQVDSIVSYNRIRQGTIYLNRGRVVLYTPTQFSGDQRCSGIKIGKMNVLPNIQQNNVKVLESEEGENLSKDEYEQELNDEMVWVQNRESYEDMIERLEVAYYLYTDPHSVTTKLKVLENMGEIEGEAVHDLCSLLERFRI